MRPIRPTTYWAVISKWGDVHTNTVSWRRGDAIDAYLTLWDPRCVPDWKERSRSWRWKWLKRHHDCRVEKIRISSAGD